MIVVKASAAPTPRAKSDQDPAARKPLPHVRVIEAHDLSPFDAWMAARTDEERRAGA